MEGLVRQRGSIKASLTNFAKYVSNLLRSDELLPENVFDLQERLNSLECSMLQRFADIQDKIDRDCDETELEDEHDERCEFENKYYKVLATAKNILANNKKLL
ncbi:unnamed protein product [Acanthoscelides obtectus]|uniref:Uncharacterized protein n=1 Tax=Acanthoscelides obtectus TaxID=200917 RepID=A0A9P0LKP1_ACAOB|nr:unnamed protein product [Acanthoscelides obtectus]CAK1680637.1 hypothetical protein AOBTE_LOCUS32817 [Acanthoscelides obtectus]